MNSKQTLHKILTLLIAAVWLINGLFCKLLNLVPRHQQIVSRILGEEYPGILTKAIGLTEVFMALWIVSGIRSRFCAITQILIVVAMNTIEFFLAPDLLLFGKINAVFALFFCIIIYINTFLPNNTLQSA
jgi:uncharacterized membrane protein YphA (DoxX/SURF4 family)